MAERAVPELSGLQAEDRDMPLLAEGERVILYPGDTLEDGVSVTAR